MALRHRRPVSLLLAAHALVLAGCGQAPVPTIAPTPAKAPITAPAAHSAAKAPSVTLKPGETPAAAIAPERPSAPPSELFAADYSEARYKASAAETADPEVAKEVQAQLSIGGGGLSWGKIGGGIGAGLLGTGFLGYFVYAGQVGAKDLMTPVTDAFRKTPDAYGVPFEGLTFHSHDGLKLAAWYVPASVPTNKGLVVFHGHTSNKDTMFKKYGWLRQKYNLFLYDSRYHGDSEGKYTTLGYYERKDAQIAIDQLRARGNTSVGLIGESMGGAVAINAGAADKGVKAVWSDCAFSSLQDAIAPRAAARKYPMATGVGMAVVATVSVKARARVATADPVKVVKQLTPRPLYLVHGQKDDDTTPINAEKLHEAAKGPNTTMWWTADADHAQSVDKYPAEYKTRAFAFFDAAL